VLRQPISRPLGLVISDFRGAAIGEIRALATWHEPLEAVGVTGQEQTQVVSGENVEVTFALADLGLEE
jgi:hypothetical protein